MSTSSSPRSSKNPPLPAALHGNTAIYRDGYLYGFDGRNEPDASLACVDAANGKVVWRETPEWTETLDQRGGSRQQILGTYRGSLLAADGHFLFCLGELGHLLWMELTPKGYKEVSRAWLFAARESWALSSTQPRFAVRRAEHPRSVAGLRSAAALLRPEGVDARSIPAQGDARPGRSGRVGRVWRYRRAGTRPDCGTAARAHDVLPALTTRAAAGRS